MVTFVKYILRIFLPLVIMGSVVACEEDERIESIVVTEEILFIGSDKVRMSGRVLLFRRGSVMLPGKSERFPDQANIGFNHSFK